VQSLNNAFDESNFFIRAIYRKEFVTTATNMQGKKKSIYVQKVRTDTGTALLTFLFHSALTFFLYRMIFTSIAITPIARQWSRHEQSWPNRAS